MSHYPKVLVISHNVFSASNNMGKTMADLLGILPSENLAQLYFHSEVPTLKMCKKYFRITDKNMIKSFFTRKSKYKIFNENDIQEELFSSRTDKGFTAKVYQFSRRRTPFIYFMRNLLWSMGKWESKELNEWIHSFNPDVIFFASGDYSFAYKIVYKIATKFNLPVVMYCCDDHYTIHEQSFLYKYVKNNLVKWAKKVANVSKSIIAISDKMKKDYSILFNKDVDVLRISAEKLESNDSSRKGIVYAGNLGVNRIEPLLELASVLGGHNMVIDIYSNEQDPNRLSLLNNNQGIHFHGSLNLDELKEVLRNTKYVLHVEAFDEESKRRTRYSLSTKIGESLQSGACILAYGPKDISSMEYLIENQACLFIEDKNELPRILNELSDDEYHQIIENSYLLADKYHNKQKNNELILKIFNK